MAHPGQGAAILPTNAPMAQRRNTPSASLRETPPSIKISSTSYPANQKPNATRSSVELGVTAHESRTKACKRKTHSVRERNPCVFRSTNKTGSRSRHRGRSPATPRRKTKLTQPAPSENVGRLVLCYASRTRRLAALSTRSFFARCACHGSSFWPCGLSFAAAPVLPARRPKMLWQRSPKA